MSCDFPANFSAAKMHDLRFLGGQMRRKRNICDCGADVVCRAAARRIVNNGGDIIGWLEYEEQAIQTENPIVVDWMARIATSICLLTEVLSRIAGRGSQYERTKQESSKQDSLFPEQVLVWR